MLVLSSLFAAAALQASPPVTTVGTVVHKPRCAIQQINTGTFYGNHTLCVQKTGRIEKYHIEGPALPLAEDAPLIVLFHSYNRDHLEHLAPTWNTYDFYTAAVNAGYIVVMHDGGFDNVPAPNEGHRALGSTAFHHHTEAVIQDVLEHFPIDRDRIYGYGFSMGGGNVLNYAARHLDPLSDNGMFAAVVNHTGTVSGPLEYHTDTGQQIVYESQHGDTYANKPFRYRKATVLDIPCDVPDPGACSTPTVCAPGTAGGLSKAHSLARNLSYLPIETWYNICDNNHILVSSNQELDNLMTGAAGPVYETHQTAPGGNLHQWKKVPSLDVLAHFNGKYLYDVTSAPTGGNVLFTKNGERTLFMRGQKIVGTDFGRMIYTFDALQNRILLFTTAAGVDQNLSEISLIVDQYSPLIAGQDLIINNNFGPDIPINVEGYDVPPNKVYKDGIDSPGSWTWNSTDKIVEIDDNTGMVAGWLIEL